MKRSYISPEFNYTKVNGTLNMLEERTFFGSKMLEIEDEVVIDNRDIIYYQKNNKEQINLVQEKLLTPVIYSASIDKESNHSLTIDESQTEFEKLNNTKWILKINTRELLRNYVFSQLKFSRVFEGVISLNTRSNSINEAIYDYVDQNVMDRYNFTRIDLYLKYNSLLESGNFQSPNVPIDLLINGKNTDCKTTSSSPGNSEVDPEFIETNGNLYNESILSSNNLESKIQTDITFDQKILTVNFKQAQKRSEFNYDYYFNIIFRKV